MLTCTENAVHYYKECWVEVHSLWDPQRALNTLLCEMPLTEVTAIPWLLQQHSSLVYCNAITASCNIMAKFPISIDFQSRLRVSTLNSSVPPTHVVKDFLSSWWSFNSSITPTRFMSIFISRTMALGSAQPLTEMITRNLPGGKGRPAEA
jgi:hypothetical protein